MTIGKLAAYSKNMNLEPELDPKRTEYIVQTHDVRRGTAKAIQLAEQGFSPSGASHVLDVTESTTRSYWKEAREEIGKWVMCCLVNGEKPEEYDTGR